MISLTVSRAELDLDPLAIGAYPSSLPALWVPEDGLGRVARVWSRVMVSSPFIHGEVMTHRRLEHGSRPLSILARAATTAGLDQLMDSVDAAFSQWSYDLTVTVDGQARVWTCDTADVSWGDVASGMARAHMARATLTIPCYPLAASA